MTAGTTKMASWQYLMLGEDPPGMRLELVDGEIVVSPSPTPQHGRAVARLFRQLDDYVESKRLGEVLMDLDTILDEHTVRRPDLMFYSTARRHFITDERTTAVPDLAIEVISPGSIESDRKVKIEHYAKAGIAFYWIVDPAQRSLHAYELVHGRYLLIAEGCEEQLVRASPFDELPIQLAPLWR